MLQATTMDSFEESRNEFLWNSSDTGEALTILDDEGGPFPLCIQKGEAQQHRSLLNPRNGDSNLSIGQAPVAGRQGWGRRQATGTRVPDSQTLAKHPQAPPVPAEQVLRPAPRYGVPVDLIQGGRQQAKVAKVDDVVVAWVVAVVCDRSRKSPQGVAKPFPPSQASTLKVLDAHTWPE